MLLHGLGIQEIICSLLIAAGYLRSSSNVTRAMRGADGQSISIARTMIRLNESKIVMETKRGSVALTKNEE
jgi:hypothetical protein